MDCRVILGDALEVLRGLPDGSVDAVVTDPPYGQSNESYDRGVDSAVWRECFRVAGPNAALISFAGAPTYHRIASDIEASGWKVRQMWGWVYRDGMPTSAWPKEGFDRLVPAMDPVCYATRGKVLLRMDRVGDAWKATRYTAGYSERAGLCRTTSGKGHYPRSIVASEGVEGFQYFLASRTNGYRHERVGHPNQKPLWLMRWLLGKLPPGGLVLDPFAGSGSTGVAALAEGFSFLGVEKAPAYHALALRRLEAARAECPLFADAR